MQRISRRWEEQKLSESFPYQNSSYRNANVLKTPSRCSARLVLNLEFVVRRRRSAVGPAVIACFHYCYSNRLEMRKPVGKWSQQRNQWCHSEPDFICQSWINCWGLFPPMTFHWLHFHTEIKHRKDRLERFPWIPWSDRGEVIMLAMDSNVSSH